MKISAAIMAHESRINRIDYLLETLGDVPVFMDYGKIGDPGNLGPWGNAKRAWKAFDPKADFHMVVQDDVVFGKRFIERLVGLLSKYGPEYAYCLFANANGPQKDDEFRTALKRPQGIIIHKELYSAVAVALPTGIIKKMIPFADKAEYDRGRGTWLDDDARISEYLKHIEMKVIYPIPSLVNHNKRLNSLIGLGHNRGRQAKFFI
jgi:hypothetical protein